MHVQYCLLAQGQQAGLTWSVMCVPEHTEVAHVQAICEAVSTHSASRGCSSSSVSACNPSVWKLASQVPTAEQAIATDYAPIKLASITNQIASAQVQVDLQISHVC